jgi:pimeloyl-ACP methyl ester carboxylesterase
MPTPRDMEIHLPHLTLAARAWGEPHLPKLLALHGWLDNAATFDRLAPQLCEHFHIVAIDFPGHGRSGWRPAGTWYHYVDYLNDVLAAADALQWRRFSLLGHSLGGAVASALSAACPERMELLLLIEALGPLATDASRALELLQKALHERAGVAEKMLRVFADDAIAVAARRQANGLSEVAAAALVARGIKAVPGGFSWSSDPRLTLTSPQRYMEEQIGTVLRGIRAPTLLLLAQPEQPYLQREMIERRIAQVADIEVHRLAGTHHLHLEDPQPVAAAVLRFAQEKLARTDVA